MKGTGSKSSPIAIEDSEEEVIQELVNASFSSNSPTERSHHTYGKRPLTERMALDQEDVQLYETVEPGKRPPKRKRVPQEPQNVSIPDVRHRNPNGPLHDSGRSAPQIISKKARKRQRRLERQALEAEQGPRQPLLPSVARQGPPGFASLPALPSWTSQMMAYPMFEPQFSPFPDFTPNNPHYPGILQHPYMHNATPPPPALSSSAWVSSMAQAAETTSVQGDVSGWDPVIRQSERPPPTPESSQAPITNFPPPAQPQPRPAVSSRKHVQTSAAEASHPRPQNLPPRPKSSSPPPPLPPIGMKPEQDPSSKHGLFQIQASSSSSGKQYIPNPARTLVIEQLPKPHRNTDWINKWGKKACGIHPVYVSIDGPAAKALIEFSTAELARKAWSSPKLGQNLTGMKTHQLKGRPREDLVKVWWYRMDGVGAGAGVGEIEEGEIEGDDGEKEVEAPVKKETKKERKARLARERLEKQAKLQSSKPATQPAQAPTAPPSLPFNPNRYTTPPHFPSFPPQLAQAGNTWRDNHSLPKKPDTNSYGASFVEDGKDSSSIASSRSPSPVPVESETPGPHPMEVDDPISPYFPVEVNDSLPLLIAQTGRARIASQPQLHAAPPDPIAPIPLRIPDAPKPMVPNSISSPPLISPPLSASATPPPSEPRAMKNAPKGPSFAKRSLLARHKELEERIARSKMELGMEAETVEPRRQPAPESEPSTPQTEVDPAVSSGSLTPTVPQGQDEVVQHEPTMEQQLRMRVLQSKKKKLQPATPSEETPDPIPLAQPPPLSSAASSSSSSSALPPSAVSSSSSTPLPPLSTGSSATSTSFSLDDLAVTFIAETIQTFKTSPMLPVPPPPPMAPPSNIPRPSTKSELAARHQRLEQYITKSKQLVLQLGEAKTKQDRERIMVLWKEQQRLMEEERRGGTSTPVPNGEQNGGGNGSRPQSAQAFATVAKWPESHHSAGVLIVSDDEEGDESDCDDDMA